MTRIVLIDNFDSFTYNVFQLLCEVGADVVVHRNNAITLDGIRALTPHGIVISPGPGLPVDAGISCDVIREFADEIPILGVCLGHQCIGEVYGGKIVRAGELVHGKTSPIQHVRSGVFAGVPSPFDAVRYHSLVIARDTVPDELEVTAVTAGGLVMGLRHREHAVEGVQFHPESILSEHGATMLRNFLSTTTAEAAA